MSNFLFETQVENIFNVFRTPKAPGKAGRSPKKSVVLSATEESESEDIFEPSPPKKMEG